MNTLKNNTVINASMEKVWHLLADVSLLGDYDPTIKSCTCISQNTTGPGAKRRIEMLDGKNWFEERVLAYEQNKTLVYQLTACSFPIKGLQHSYTFESIGGNSIRVSQTMEYSVKFGLIGKLMNLLMIRKQFDTGIKKFLTGLKEHAETIR